MGEQHLAKLAEKSFDRHGDYESLFFEGQWYRSGELHDRSHRLAGGQDRPRAATPTRGLPWRLPMVIWVSQTL